RLVVRELTPALAEPYEAVPGDGRDAEIDETLMMAPPLSCSRITAYAARATASGPSRLSPTIFSGNRSEASAARAYGAAPALLTTTPRRPWSATTPSTRTATSSASRTSQVRCSVPGAASATGRRAQVTTVAPASTNRRAMPAPIPCDPPVTRTTRPLRSMVIDIWLPSKVEARSERTKQVLGYQANVRFGPPTRKAHLQWASP